MIAPPGTSAFTHRAVTCMLALSLLLGVGCSKAKPPAMNQPASTTKPAGTLTTAPETTTPATPTAPSKDDRLVRGKELYGNHCSPCHGEVGDGNGLAARFLFPKPRNFREAKFRLVTTVNRMPSDDDFMRVISRGMPGSAMFSFAHLSEADRAAIVTYVRQLSRVGVEDRLRQSAKELGEAVDEKEMAQDVDRLVQPGKTMAIPTGLPSPGSESVAHGRELYLKQCATCHGQTGKGDGVQDQRDDDGTPTSPRDYTHGIFKGGRELEQLYARIALGMPGSPMPASSNFQPADIGDMVNFIQSLSDPSAQAKVEHKRVRLAAKHIDGTLPGEIPDTQWESAAAAPVVVSPLWWRNYTEPDLHVQAIHDGRTLAVRLSWADPTRDQQTIRPQEFADMAAVQLYKGTREPFLGMGATDGLVDVWLWHAGWQADLAEYSDVDTAYPNMAVDIYPFEQKEDGARPHATQLQSRDFITAHAAGNLRADPERGMAASGMQAKGFGSLTMLPKTSQVVEAHGKWSDGRWVVVLRRPLEVSGDSGLQLAPGDKLSIAFAIWDGAAKDRNGQKLVSIWQDLALE